LPFQNKKKDKYILNPQRLTLAKDIDAPGNFTIYMDSLKQERFKEFDEVPMYGAYIDMYRHGVENPFLTLIKFELSKEKVKEEAKKRAKRTEPDHEKERLKKEVEELEEQQKELLLEIQRLERRFDPKQTQEEHEAGIIEVKKKYDELTQRLDKLKRKKRPPAKRKAELVKVQKGGRSNKKTNTGKLKAGYLSKGYEDEHRLSLVPSLKIRENNFGLPEDPNELNKGTQLTLSIPENFEDIGVYIWDDKLKPYKVLFSEWAKDIKEGSPEWWDKEPIVASTLDGKQAFWVHDTDWYNEETIASGNAKVIQEGKQNVRAIRNLVKEKGKVSIVITEKSDGYYSTFPEDETKTLIESNPKAQILAVKQNDIVSKRYELKENVMPGIYDIRLGVNKGEYVVFQYISPKLSDKIVDSIINVFRAYIYKDEVLREEFKTLTKLDLFNISDIQEYFSLFIHFEKFQQSSLPLVLEELQRFEKGTFVLGFKGNDIVASQIGVAPDEQSYLQKKRYLWLHIYPH